MWRLVEQIPLGQVATYGDLARALGSAAAARWVGQELANHVCRRDCGCHRVVLADGGLGDYADGGSLEKGRRLIAEGASVADNRVTKSVRRFRDFVGPCPLAELQDQQRQMAQRVRLVAVARVPRKVAALDVSYARDASGAEIGVMEYVLMDADGKEVLWAHAVERPVTFPYLSGFLAFREAPLLIAAWQAALEAGQLADVYLVDGSGVLHPRGAGLAVHFGVTLNVPTIGVTKRRLCGSLVRTGKPRGAGELSLPVTPVQHEGRQLGVALPQPVGNRGTADREKWLYVSPGHRVSVKQAGQFAARLMQGHKLPEPLYWADRWSRERAREITAGKDTLR